MIVLGPATFREVKLVSFMLFSSHFLGIVFDRGEGRASFDHMILVD